jgi:hypothetical protein
MPLPGRHARCVHEDEEPRAEWPFAVELAAMPDVWRALLESHVSGRDGRCRGCYSQVRSAPHWPCPLYGAAAQARRIAAGTNGTVIPPRLRPGSARHTAQDAYGVP